MRTMKDSGEIWIGAIPHDWSLGKLKYVAPEQRLVAQRNCRYIGLENIESGTGRLISYSNGEENNALVIKKGDVLFGKLRPYLSKSLLVKEDASCSSEFAIMRPRKISAKFLTYITLDPAFVNQIDVSTYGTKMPRANWSYIGNLLVPIPDASEQKAISSYLDSHINPIDEAISRHRQAIDKLEEYRRAIISCVIGGRAEEVDSYGWTWKRFKFIARVDSNLVEPNKYTNWLHIAPDAIGKGNGKLLQKHTVSEDGVVSSNHLFRKGAILYSKVRPRLNKVVVAPDDGLCSADMYPISTTQNVEWLKFYMLSDQFVQQAGLVSDIRIKMPKINKQELGDIKILVPPPNVQLEIVSRLNAQCYAIDEAIGRQNQIIDKLVEYRRSLIHVAVTGQIDCTKEPL